MWGNKMKWRCYNDLSPYIWSDLLLPDSLGFECIKRSPHIKDCNFFSKPFFTVDSFFPSSRLLFFSFCALFILTFPVRWLMSAAGRSGNVLNVVSSQKKKKNTWRHIQTKSRSNVTCVTIDANKKETWSNTKCRFTSTRDLSNAISVTMLRRCEASCRDTSSENTVISRLLVKSLTVSFELIGCMVWKNIRSSFTLMFDHLLVKNVIIDRKRDLIYNDTFAQLTSRRNHFPVAFVTSDLHKNRVSNATKTSTKKIWMIRIL